MDWLQAPNAWLARLLLERAIAGVYLVAFLVALNQFPALLGERGLLPTPRYLARVPFQRSPSLFHRYYSDRFVRAISCVGIVLSASLLGGLPQTGPVWAPMLVWTILWLLYLSIVNVGQTFYAFGWESLLLEAGFLSILLGPASIAPPVPVLWAFRWLLFRVEFGAGLIKIRGDTCWRDLTCLYYHHETQPMPNPLSWYFHHLPKPVHRLEVLGNHVTQLVVPFLLFFPQPFASAAGVAMLAHQSWLIASGNFAWLNALTLALAFSAFDDAWLGTVLPFEHGPLAAAPTWFSMLVVAFAVVVLVLSFWPARNLLSRRQLMNASFNPLHLVNAYGAFGSITRERFEIVIEGTDAPQASPDAVWREYAFKGKPGDPARRPPQVAPYHLRLDWLMWFAAMSTPMSHPWLLVLTEKLLLADRQTLRLLRRDPFDGRRPTFVRASLYRYRFSTRRERRERGVWWIRTQVGAYIPPLSLEETVPDARHRSAS
ncbi:MAG TPA: lipase maturation factor family protein [Actinomycetota bacterium]|jgi:hypothetical protein